MQQSESLCATLCLWFPIPVNYLYHHWGPFQKYQEPASPDQLHQNLWGTGLDLVANATLSVRYLTDRTGISRDIILCSFAKRTRENSEQ